MTQGIAFVEKSKTSINRSLIFLFSVNDTHQFRAKVIEYSLSRK